MSGAKDGGVSKPAELSPDSLLNVIAAVFFVGLAAVVVLMALMKDGVGFNPIILVAAALSFLLTFLVEAVLIGLLLSGRRGAKRADAAGRAKEHTTRELAEAQARVLPEPVPSVTEHTTRTFDPHPFEGKSK